jgi:DDE superfamily endonuclease
MVLRLDSGFQGFLKDYVCQNALLPIKKKRKAEGVENDLSPSEKEYNKGIARERIVVENSIAGMKRYNLIANRLRIKVDSDYRNDAILVAAGLWNFNLSNNS